MGHSRIEPLENPGSEKQTNTGANTRKWDSAAKFRAPTRFVADAKKYGANIRSLMGVR
jgi:hypothetical protein